jgi:multidrug resistance protein, MATE family
VWYVTVGASSALDTLGSQSWGAGDPAGLHKWACICLVVLTLMNIVGAIVLGLGEPIARHILDQDAEVSALVGTYCQSLIPGMFPLSWALALHKVLQVQGRVVVPMGISVAAFFVNLAGNAALIEAFGFNGAPIATTVSRFAMLLFTLLYMTRHNLIPGLPFCSRSVDFKHMFSTRGAFMALASHGAMMMGLEAASFDVTTAFAAFLGEVQVSAHSALINVIAFTFFSFPYGVAVASSMRVVSCTPRIHDIVHIVVFILILLCRLCIACMCDLV